MAALPPEDLQKRSLAPSPDSKTDRPQSTPLKKAQDRKVDAATSVASGADNSVAEVLELARQKADQKLAQQKEELATKLADRMVTQELGQIEAVAGFFLQQWGDSDRLLAPFKQVLEAEVIES